MSLQDMISVFDSGVDCLSVFMEIRKLFPEQVIHVVY